MKGVPHYLKDGTIHKGGSHKMPNGEVHTGKTHSDKSQKLFHFEELSDSAKKKPRSPKELPKKLRRKLQRKPLRKRPRRRRKWISCKLWQKEWVGVITMAKKKSTVNKAANYTNPRMRETLLKRSWRGPKAVNPDSGRRGKRSS